MQDVIIQIQMNLAELYHYLFKISFYAQYPLASRGWFFTLNIGIYFIHQDILIIKVQEKSLIIIRFYVLSQVRTEKRWGRRAQRTLKLSFSFSRA